MAEFKDGSYVIKDGTIYKVNIDLARIFGADINSIPFFLKKTNADRIRSMSDEELAEYISHFCDCDRGDCPVCTSSINCGNGCKQAWLGWLRREAEDGDK